MPILYRSIHRFIVSSVSNQFIAAVCAAALITGCSSSGTGNDTTPASDDNNPTQSTPDGGAATTDVTFDITVPAYSSNALQVRLQWNNKDLNASWVKDESWTATDEFTNKKEYPLTVSFNDANGAVTLASFETNFKPDAAASQVYTINADQFNATKWDSDNDGVSNLAEAIAGDNPLGSNVPVAVQASLALEPDKAFQFTWKKSDSAEFYRLLENPDGLSGFTQVGDDIDSATLSYKHRVALYNRVNASYIVQACNSNGCSDSATMTVPSSLESAITYIKASNAEISDSFGAAVSLNHDGTVLAIGAPNEDSASTEINGDQSDNEAGAAGAAYVFERVNELWQQKDYLKPSNAEESDQFGAALELSADGNTLAISSPNEGSWKPGLENEEASRGSNFGSVYIFKRSNGAWVQHAYLKPEEAIHRGKFGSVLSLSDDGNTLAAGFGSIYFRSGAAYVFAETNNLWSQQAKLVGSNTEGGWYDQDGDDTGGDYFGRSLSLSSDGKTLAVGAAGEGSSAQGINGDQSDNSARSSGAVYTFTRNGNAWQQQAYIKSSNSEQWDAFGTSLSINGDGSTLAVYASGEDSVATGVDGDQEDNSARDSGAIYTFTQAGGVWQQESYIKPIKTGAIFGAMKPSSLSANGDVLAAGNNVYVYRDSAWQLQVNLQSISGSEKVYNGYPVISGDGNTVAIGDSSEESSDSGINGDRYDYFGDYSGAVYLY